MAGWGQRCWACNGPKPVCKSCSCTNKGLTCSSCCPGEHGPCHNTATPDCSSSPRAASLQLTQKANRNSTPSSSDFPSLHAISSTRVFTFPHIPKGAWDAWAGVLIHELSAICSCPQYLARLMMLTKCILQSLIGRSLSISLGTG